MELGGNIGLEGFSELERDKLIVVKKIVGNYVKGLSETSRNFEKIVISRTDSIEGDFEIRVDVVNNGETISAESTNQNLFMALDSSLKKVEKEII